MKEVNTRFYLRRSRFLARLLEAAVCQRPLLARLATVISFLTTTAPRDLVEGGRIEYILLMYRA